MRKTFALIAFVLFVLAGCKPGLPDGIIPQDEMEDILVDYHLAQGIAEQTDRMVEVERYKCIQAVFQKHGITEAEFDSSMVYYCVNSELFMEMYGRIMERLQVKAQLMGVNTNANQNRFANLTAFGDTANIWVERNFATMQPNRLMNVYQFAVEVDSSFHKGDAFIWHFKTQYITQATMHEAYAQLAIEYDNDSVVTRDLQVRGSSEFNLEFEPSSSLDSIPVRCVRGFVFMPLLDAKTPSGFQLLILQDLSLIRMHREPKVPIVEELTDSLKTDSLPADTIDHAPKASDTRMTPMQMRENQPREQKIHVVKDKDYKPARRQPGTPMRRRML